MKIRKNIKSILTVGFISMFILSSVNISNAENNVEAEFNQTLNKYKDKNISLEDGVVLKVGENIDLSSYKDAQLSNNEVARINENGILETLEEGTVYLSITINNTAYIIEIGVVENLETNTRQRFTRQSNKYKVFIDAGHGGSDPGAVANGVEEADVNLAVAKLVREKLQFKGIEVLMSRDTDVFYTLLQRSEMSNNYNPHVFVSIHSNSASSSASGIETFYHTNKVNFKPLSDNIQSDMILQTGARNRGVKSANFSVLRNTNSPSALVENGFLTNIQEAMNLKNPLYQDKLATGIANGIEKYLKDNISLDVVPPTNEDDTTTSPETDDNNQSNFNPPSTDESVDVDFNDIDDHWAKDYIIEFVKKGIIAGYEDNTFKPNNSITRSEFIKLINKTFEFTKIGEVKFDDISPKEWFYHELEIAMGNGYINGYEDNTFRPNKEVSRQEASAMIANITGILGDGVLSFKDTDEIGNWAKPSVDALNDNNLIKGYSDNTFRPNGSMTRAEAVVILSRILQQVG